MPGEGRMPVPPQRMVEVNERRERQMADKTCAACGGVIDDSKPFIRCGRASEGKCPEVRPGTKSLADLLLDATHPNEPTTE